MNMTIANLIGSHELSVMEVLTNHQSTGLTIPEISKVGGIPYSTCKRIVERFSEKNLLRIIGKYRKASVYTLNFERPDVVDAARALAQYTLWRVEEKTRDAGHCTIDDYAPLEVVFSYGPNSRRASPFDDLAVTPSVSP